MENQHLLDVLQAHGENFLNSFNLPVLQPVSKVEEDAPCSSCSSTSSWSQESDEWTGISWNSHNDNELESTHLGADTGSDVVLFQDTYNNHERSNAIKAQAKAFMSAKVSKLNQGNSRSPRFQEEEREDLNHGNDAALHRLIHTQLLSAASNADLEKTPAQRRKALEGRILELSGAAKLGQGEGSVRDAERNKASKRVRFGLLSKEKAKAKRELEEAKFLGNYHPSMKRQFQKAAPHPARKRMRGLKLGVGKFSGGLLKLSNNEINLADGRIAGGDSGITGSKGGGGKRRTTRRWR